MTLDQNNKTLVYDAWNRLTAYKNGASTLTSYSYDAESRRIVESPASVTATDLYYSNQWQVLEERQSSTVKAQQVWGAGYVDQLVLRDRDAIAGGSLGTT